MLAKPSPVNFSKHCNWWALVFLSSQQTRLSTSYFTEQRRYVQHFTRPSQAYKPRAAACWPISRTASLEAEGRRGPLPSTLPSPSVAVIRASGLDDQDLCKARALVLSPLLAFPTAVEGFAPVDWRELCLCTSCAKAGVLCSKKWKGGDRGGVLHARVTEEVILENARHPSCLDVITTTTILILSSRDHLPCSSSVFPSSRWMFFAQGPCRIE